MFALSVYLSDVLFVTEILVLFFQGRWGCRSPVVLTEMQMFFAFLYECAFTVFFFLLFFSSSSSGLCLVCDMRGSCVLCLEFRS